MPDTVHTLTAAMAAGEARAVEAFYRQYFDTMYRHACNLTRRDESFCLDVVQDAVMRVIRTVRPVSSEAQFASWLRLVTQTAAYDLLKAESRRKRREAVVAVVADAATHETARQAEDEEQLARLREQIAALDPQIVRMIELRYEGGWTLAKIADAMGLSVGTIDGRLRRALRGLRTRQEQEV